MAINVEVTKKKNENNGSVLKRFTRRVQESGVLPRVRSIRYSERTMSPYVRQQKKLKYLRKKVITENLIKLGKMPEARVRRRR